jgi:phage-related minor tail protein
MSTTKKKPGRPKKVVNEAPKKEVKNAAYYKNMVDSLLETNNQLGNAYQAALEDKEYWFQRADQAYKDQETMLETVEELVTNTINTLLNVHETTNEINTLDIIYNVTMIHRVIDVKFNSPTEE